MLSLALLVLNFYNKVDCSFTERSLRAAPIPRLTYN